MKKCGILILVAFIQAGMAQAHEPHPRCVTAFERIGYENAVALNSCQIAAYKTCSQEESEIIQLKLPGCVARLLNGVRGITDGLAINFCGMAAKRTKVCVPADYISQRAEFTSCTIERTQAGEDFYDVLIECLKKVLGVPPQFSEIE